MNESEFKLEASVAPPPLKLRLIGVGGGGVNAVDRLRAEQLSGLDVIAINTDQRALQACGVQEKLLIGANLTRGLGAGGTSRFAFGELLNRVQVALLHCKGSCPQPRQSTGCVWKLCIGIHEVCYVLCACRKRQS